MVTDHYKKQAEYLHAECIALKVKLQRAEQSIKFYMTLAGIIALVGVGYLLMNASCSVQGAVC